MLRFTGVIGGSLAALVVVPATVLGANGAEDALTSVERALARTVQALEVLAGLEQRAQQGEPITAAIAREVTEPGPSASDPSAREDADRRLELLRAQVSLLQQELDVVEARELGGPAGEFSPPDPTGSSATPSPLLGVTRGLDGEMLAELERLGDPNDASAVRTRSNEPPVEHEGYSADPLLQARACYRAGRFEHGVLLLAEDDSPGALYWRGRCLERLGRLDEALALYEMLAARPNDGDEGGFAERARTSLEFVRWRQALERDLAPSGAVVEGEQP